MTTIAQVTQRALDRSVANRGASLVPSDAITLHRVQRDISELFQALASLQRTYFQTDAVLASTASVGAAARRVNLADLVVPCVRVLRVLRDEDDVEVKPVDVRNTEAEYAPRYYTSGTELVEVYPDWDEGDPASVDLRIFYIFGPEPLDLTGDLTQDVTTILPEDFHDLIDNRFAKYLVEKDPGRPPEEAAALDTDYGERFQALVQYFDNLSGAIHVGVAVPTPTPKP